MRALIAVVLAAAMLAGRAYAIDPPSCAVPDYLLFGDSSLKRVAAAVGKQHKLSITVFGTGSSTLAGPDGATLAYPARLEAALGQRLPGITVKVTTRTKSAQTAEMMRRNMKETLIDPTADLLIWQTGTVDAIRRVESDEFRAALDAGIDVAQRAGSDVVLMNMQYSPRTESMIPVGPYVDDMRAVALQHEVPLFDRFAIMHYWADEGAFDFYAPGRDNGLAQRVHDCVGRAIASLVVEAGHLQPFAVKTSQ
jgi:hypothetical protein